MEEISFSSLVGKTIVSVRVRDDEIYFTMVDGEVFKQYHSQNCCEAVYVESINGDLDDLIGTPILVAEETTSSDDPSDFPKREYEQDSQTWTFYKIRTIKGSVDIRWYGASNGHYSESVDFVQMEN